MIEKKPVENLIEKYDTIDICRFLLNNQMYNCNYKKQDIHEALEENKRLVNRELGVIHVTFSKKMLQEGRSVVISSFETLEKLSKYISHWTPQIYMWGAKNNVGRNKKNIRAYIDFVVEMDQKVSLAEIFFASSLTKIGTPTLVLDKGKGIHVYYRCSNPFYGSSSARWTFERIAEYVTDELAQYLPVDKATNPVGYFRFPKKEDVIFYNPTYVVDSKAIKKIASEKGYLTRKSEKKTFKKSFIIKKRETKTGRVIGLLNTEFMKAIMQRTDILGSKGKLGRNNWIFTISLACKADQLDVEEALKKCYDCNKNLKSPLSDSEVEKTVRSAFKGKWRGPSRRYLTIFSPIPINYSNFQFITPAIERSERIQSHYEEWSKDIIEYLKLNTDEDMPFIGGSQREIGKTIGQYSEVKKSIPKSSLMQVINSSKDIVMYRKKDKDGKIIKSGRSAGMIIALRTTLRKALLKRKKKKDEQNIIFRIFLVNSLEKFEFKIEKNEKVRLEKLEQRSSFFHPIKQKISNSEILKE